MIVTLDGRRFSPESGSAATLETLVNEVRQACPADRIVVEVRFDGQPLTGDDLEARMTRSIDGTAQIDFSSACPRELACDALREIVTQLDDAVEVHHSVARDFQSGRATVGAANMGGLLATWQACCQAYRHCSDLLGSEIQQLPADRRPGSPQIASLVSRLREVRDAFDARDYVLLADQLEFELAPLCIEWRDRLAALIDELHATQPA